MGEKHFHISTIYCKYVSVRFENHKLISIFQYNQYIYIKLLFFNFLTLRKKINASILALRHIVVNQFEGKDFDYRNALTACEGY